MTTSPDIHEEPARGRTAEVGLLRLSGIDQLLAGIQGRTPAPPIHHLTGLRPSEAGIGRSTFTMPATEWLQNPIGIFPGGVLAFLADAPLGGALSTGLPPGKILTTSELSMSFLRPASPRSTMLIGRGAAVHSGRSVGLSEVHVEDAEGHYLAHGTSRLVVLDVPVDDSVPIPERDEPITDPPDPYLRPASGRLYDADVLDRMDGLEQIQVYIDGRFEPPPVGRQLGSRITHRAQGRCPWRLAPTRRLWRPPQPLYGGAIAFIADAALSGAIGSTLPAGTTYGVLDLKVQFVRPVFPETGDLTAEGWVTHRGRSMAVANAEIRNGEGKPAAFATGSAMLLPGGVRQLLRAEPAAPPPDEGGED
jgi:uncharacterized protein (TIGR00369 family)